MKESRKEFIKKAYSAACSEWKENIEKEFPKLFKKDALKVGKWYKSRNCLFNYQKQGNVYGFYTDGGWINGGWSWDDTSAKPATDKEVEEALIKEAKRRGYRKGVVIITSKTGVNRTLNSNNFEMIGNNFVCLSSKESCIYPSVFTNGKWATITETITKEQAEKALIKEAEKRGYENVKINNLESIGNMLLNHHSSISSDCYYYNVSENALWFMGRLIFWNGKWAKKIKETITKEQAEKELGKTILN